MKNIFKRLIACAGACSMISSSLSMQGAGILQDAFSPLTTAFAAGNAEAFLESSTDSKNMTVYDGTVSTHNFSMNGRTYYQGLVFDSKNKQSYAQFNVENIDTLSFTIGHVDNTPLYGATLTIELDGSGKDEIELSSVMNTEDYTLDVSGASDVRFFFDFGRYDDTSYALADFSVGSSAPAKTCDIPSFDTPEMFLKSGFNENYVTAYDGVASSRSFNMNGRTYSQGLVFNGGGRYSYTQFNVENIDTLDFTIGHVDGTELYGATLTMYVDGRNQEEIELSSIANLQEYSLDVSDASLVRFYIDFGAYRDNSYALADFSFDGKPVKETYTTPEYETSEMFLKSSFNVNQVYSYDGVATTRSFNMNGRTYYQGLVFKGIDRYAYAQFNVENVDTLDFTIGHLDGTDLYGATLTIYLDNNGEDEIELSSVMNLQEYSLDVSDASVVRFYIDFNSYRENSFALADFSVDGKEIKKTNEVPEYSNSEKFMKAGFNTNCVTYYDGSSNAKSFNMNGRTYYHGLVFDGSGRYAYIQFNVENVNSLDFTIGHLDGTYLYEGTLTIYLDGKGEDEIKLSSLMNLQEYSLDVSDASVVRFYLDSKDYNNNSYALADFSVDGNPIKKEHQVPEFETPEKFLKAGFNSNNTTTYAGNSKTDSFDMNGRTYYQGVVFNGGNRYSYEQFNVENVDSLSFTVGHIDNSYLESGTMTIYLDGKETDTIELTSNMNLRDYTLDVSDASVVRFYVDAKDYNNNAYAIADITMNGTASAKPCVIPVYENESDWLNDKFNTESITVYDGTEKTKAFEIGGEKYKQGIVFSNSNRYCYAKFNTENLESLSFRIGAEGTKESAECVLSIVADNKVIDEVTLLNDMEPLDYTLDVKDTDTVRFFVESKSYAYKSYALYDFTAAFKEAAPEPAATTEPEKPVTTTAAEPATTTETTTTPRVEVLIANVNTAGEKNPGATMSLKGTDPNGNAINFSSGQIRAGAGGKVIQDSGDALVWISGTSSTMFRDLIDGDYVICEEEAPDGYKIANSIGFSVRNGVASSTRISMIDEPAETTPDIMTTTTSSQPTTTTAKAVPATTAKAVPTTTAKPVPATTAKAVPTTTAKAAPTTTAKAVPATTAKAVPATTAKAVPATTAEVVPATTAKAVPATTAEAVPATTAKAVPATTAKPVEEGTTVPTTASGESGSSTETTAIGDINKDGVVDSSDASEILMLYAQVSTGGDDVSDETKAVADINDDGLVDSSDASLILEYYAYVSTGGTDTADVYFSKQA